MSFSTKVAAPPPPPAPVDPGQASLSFIQAMASPELQGQLFQAESTYRPQYTALSQRDLYNTLMGSAPGTEGGYYGTLDLAALFHRGPSTNAYQIWLANGIFGLVSPLPYQSLWTISVLSKLKQTQPVDNRMFSILHELSS